MPALCVDVNRLMYTPSSTDMYNIILTYILSARVSRFGYYT